MSKPLEEAPMLLLNPFELMSHQAPALLAKQVQQDGPILRWTIPVGPLTGQEVVFLVGPEANRFVMHTHREHLSHEQGWAPAIAQYMGKGLLNMDPPEHTQHRKLWNPAFANAYMESYLPLIQKVIAEHTARWAEQGDIDLYNEARSITFHIATSTLAGLETNAQVERVQTLFYTLMGPANPDPEGYTERVEKALIARVELDEILLKVIAERRSMPEDEVPHDVLGLIVRARDDDGNELTDEQILGHFNILLLAGYEATTVLSTFVLYLLSTMQDQRERAEEELQSLLGDSTGLISVGATREMKVLNNFIKETGRMYSPIFAVPRQVIDEVEFGGYTLPAGTYLHLGLSACHHLPEIFENPDVFDPDRFAAPREEDKRTPYGLVTFSGGLRLCIGVHFVNIEVKMLAAHILRFYHLEPIDDQSPEQIGFFGTSIPKGVRVRVTALPQKVAMHN